MAAQSPGVGLVLQREFFLMANLVTTVIPTDDGVDDDDDDDNDVDDGGGGDDDDDAHHHHHHHNHHHHYHHHHHHPDDDVMYLAGPHAYFHDSKGLVYEAMQDFYPRQCHVVKETCDEACSRICHHVLAIGGSRSLYQGCP